MYSVAFRGQKYSVNGYVFAALALLMLVYLITGAVIVYTAMDILTGYPTTCFIAYIVLTGTLTLNEVDYAIIKNETIRKWLGRLVLVASVVVILINKGYL